MTLQLRKAAGIHKKVEGGIKTTWERQGLQWEEGAKGGLYFTRGAGGVPEREPSPCLSEQAFAAGG